MKKFEIKKEIGIWAIMILPIIYLFLVWNQLPQIVPTHFGADGQPNGWSSKQSLLYMIPGLTVGIYALLTIIPVIDPKGKIEAMGNKYFLFKLFMIVFMSIICFIVIQAGINKTLGNTNLLFLCVGGLLAFMGNYLQAIKPNYFIGIRTPWTLENETVWRKTHRLGGKLYFIAGLLIIILPFTIKHRFDQYLIAIVLTASFIPIIYSYIIFRQEKNNLQKG
jgi:uncharacterized membrane protein